MLSLSDYNKYDVGEPFNSTSRCLDLRKIDNLYFKQSLFQISLILTPSF